MGEAELMSGGPAQTRAEGLRDFDALYDVTFPLAWRTLQRLGVPRAKLDEAAREVFTGVQQRLQSTECSRTGVLELSVRVASDVRRVLRRKGEQIALDDGLPDDGPSALDAAMQRQARSVVDALLSGLDDAQREVFVLAEMEGLTGPHICEALNVKSSMLSSRLRLARAAFESRLRAFPGTDAGELLAAARGAYDARHTDRVRVRAALAATLSPVGAAVARASRVLKAVVFAASVVVGSLGVLSGADMVRTSWRPAKVTPAPTLVARGPVRPAAPVRHR
jgi:RNA polymerase sigma-70 factor (ECF subfamily)